MTTSGIFRAGYAKRDITPDTPLPLWGYDSSMRPNPLSTGVLDPLFAKTLVLEAAGRRLAVVGLDLGRAPTRPIVNAVREAARSRHNVDGVLLCASHTHHAPVLELRDEPGRGQGVYDDAVQYVAFLRDTIIDAIGEAASLLQPAQIAAASAACSLNRNRHTQQRDKPADQTLTVVRLDDDTGHPLAILVNYAGHPTLYPPQKQLISAEYPGVMMAAIEKTMNAPCLFLQGACGDLQIDIDDDAWGQKDFIYETGATLAHDVLRLAENLKTSAPLSVSLGVEEKDFAFESRLDFTNSGIVAGFGKSFFPELAQSAADDYGKCLRPHLTTALLNGSLAFVGVSGEFFCAHALRLREKLSGMHLLFAGYCNGHEMYFPTLEALQEGGYGADLESSWVSAGAGEEMMEAAAKSIAGMR